MTRPPGLPALGLLLGLAACGPEAPLELRGATMGTTWSAKVAGDVEVEAARQAIEGALERANALFSTWREDSEISRFNAHRSTEPCAASAAFAAVVRLALEVADASGGAFDPTVLPLVEARGFGPSRREAPPSEDELAAARRHVGHDKVAVLSGGRVVKRDPEVTLDLNAIAKGWGVDHVVEALAEAGVAHCMVEIGGEVRCRGTKPGGVPWTIGIERPSAGGRAIERAVPLRDAALASSGTYRNVREVGGRPMHHIVDPETGENPPGPVLSASVRASTCALADALATAFMVLGPERAADVLARFEDPELGALFLLAGEGGEVRPVEVRWEDGG